MTQPSNAAQLAAWRALRRILLTPTAETRDALAAATPSQAYYWTDAWQEAEAENLKELEAGDSHTFDSAEDAIRWLAER